MVSIKNNKKTNDKNITKKKIRKNNISKITRNNNIRFYLNHKENTKILKKTTKYFKKYVPFYNSINKQELSTLKYYKSSGYIKINNFLFNNGKLDNITVNDEYLQINKKKENFKNNAIYNSKLNEIVNKNPIQIFKMFIEKKIKMYIKHINILDNLFNNKHIHKLEGNELFFRGMSLIKFDKKNEFLFKNYISTSFDPNVSKTFMNDYYSNKKNWCCFYKIIGLKDIPYIYLPSLDETVKKTSLLNLVYDEAEIILPRNMRFKLIKKETTSINFLKKTPIVNIKDKNNFNNNNLHINKKIKIYTLKFIKREPIEPIETDNIDLSKTCIKFSKNIIKNID